MEKLYCSFSYYLNLNDGLTCFDYSDLNDKLVFDYVVVIVPSYIEVDFYYNRIRFFTKDFYYDCNAKIIFLYDNFCKDKNHELWFDDMEDVIKHYGCGNRRGICVFSKGKTILAGEEHICDWSY